MPVPSGGGAPPVLQFTTNSSSPDRGGTNGSHTVNNNSSSTDTSTLGTPAAPPPSSTTSTKQHSPTKVGFSWGSNAAAQPTTSSGNSSFTGFPNGGGGFFGNNHRTTAAGRDATSSSTAGSVGGAEEEGCCTTASGSKANSPSGSNGTPVSLLINSSSLLDEDVKKVSTASEPKDGSSSAGIQKPSFKSLFSKEGQEEANAKTQKAEGGFKSGFSFNLGNSQTPSETKSSGVQSGCWNSNTSAFGSGSKTATELRSSSSYSSEISEPVAFDIKVVLLPGVRDLSLPHKGVPPNVTSSSNNTSSHSLSSTATLKDINDEVKGSSSSSCPPLLGDPTITIINRGDKVKTEGTIRVAAFDREAAEAQHEFIDKYGPVKSEEEEKDRDTTVEKKKVTSGAFFSFRPKPSPTSSSSTTNDSAPNSLAKKKNPWVSSASEAMLQTWNSSSGVLAQIALAAHHRTGGNLGTDFDGLVNPQKQQVYLQGPKKHFPPLPVRPKASSFGLPKMYSPVTDESSGKKKSHPRPIPFQSALTAARKELRYIRELKEDEDLKKKQQLPTRRGKTPDGQAPLTSSSAPSTFDFSTVFAKPGSSFGESAKHDTTPLGKSSGVIAYWTPNRNPPDNVRFFVCPHCNNLNGLPLVAPGTNYTCGICREMFDTQFPQGKLKKGLRVPAAYLRQLELEKAGEFSW